MRKKVKDKAEPFFTRLYKRHRDMVKELLKQPDINTNADVARLGIEKLYEDRLGKKVELKETL